MKRLIALNEVLRNEGITAAIAQADDCVAENLNFLHEESENSMNSIIHDAITICNDENFQEVFTFLNKISTLFGLNVPLSLEIMSFNLRRNIDIDRQVSFFENLPNSIKESSNIQMLGSESYRRFGNIDKAVSIFSSLPPQKGWWPYDDIWSSLTHNLGCYLLQKNILFLKHQESTKWSFPFSKSKPYMVSDLVSGLLAPWRHDPITFKMDIEHLLENSHVPEIDIQYYILEFLANRIADLDADRASIVFQLIASYDDVELVERILDNKNFALENLAVRPEFVFCLDLLQQRFTQFSDVFLETFGIFLRSDAVQRFMKGDWMAFEEGYLPNSRTLAFEILSRSHNKWKNISVDYIPFLEKKMETLKKNESNTKKHLFFGLYGETKNLVLSLERIFDYIKKDTQTWRSEGNFVSIGISTFNNTESKLDKILNKFEYSDLADLREFLPNTIQIIIEKNKENLVFWGGDIKNISDEYKFSPDIYSNMLSNEAFWQDVGAEFSQYRGNNNDIELENIKTFYCLSGLQKLSEAAERSQNVDIDKMVLLNLDTTIMHGSLVNLCNQVSYNEILSAKMNKRSNSEREGDTYFVGSKNSASKLFYATQFVKNIVNNLVFGHIYKDKFSSQEIIQTILYENGCDMNFSSEVKIQKMCVDIPWVELREALIKDSFHLEDEDLLRFIRDETKNSI